MSTSSLRRQVKNIVHNYSEAEIKVREATSNDPWGPSSSLMSEIADLTYNVVAFSEIMSMVWKRLNDHGKNWRHVYKAMTLMEYLIKTGSERVAQQCRENIYAVQTLKDFQYVDRDGKDQGVNVREKAKQLVALLRDEERLREERTHALKTKEKMAQTSSASSAPSAPGLGGGPALGPAPQGPGGGTDPEQAWPQSSGEEDLQLQLALAMSKEEAEQSGPPPDDDPQLRLALSLSKEEHQKEERLRRGDDLRLQMAIEESKRENKPEEGSLMELAAVDPWGAPSGPPPSSSAPPSGPSPPPGAPPPGSSGPWGAADPWGAPAPAPPTTSDPWGGGSAGAAPPAASDPWGDSSRVNSDPWGSSAVTPPSSDPWAPISSPPSVPGASDPWGGGGTPGSAPPPYPTSSDPWSTPAQKHATNGTGDPELTESLEKAAAVGRGAAGDSVSPVPFDLSALGSALPVRKTPESFLGPNAALVDLDSLVSSKPKPSQHNPFLTQAPGSTSLPGSTISSRGVSPTPPTATIVSSTSSSSAPPPSTSNPFGSLPLASVSPQPSSLGLAQLRTSPVPPAAVMMPPPGSSMAMVQPGLPPGMGIQLTPPQLGLGMVQPGPLGMSYGGVSPMAGPGATMMISGGLPSQPQVMMGAGGGPVGSGLGTGVAGGGALGGGASGGSTNPFLL